MKLKPFPLSIRFQDESWRNGGDSPLRPYVLALVNGLTLSRLGLAAAFPSVPDAHRVTVVLAAFATEFMDGYLARRLGARSLFGQLLDPIADKAFVGAALFVLMRDKGLSPTALVALLTRDLTVLSTSAFALARPGRSLRLRLLKPRPLGKVTTTLQFLVVLGLFAEIPFSRGLLAAAILSGFASAVDYLLVSTSLLRSGRGAPSRPLDSSRPLTQAD